MRCPTLVFRWWRYGRDSRVVSGVHADVNVFISEVKPLDFDMILGMNAISSLGGVSITSRGEVNFLYPESSHSCGEVFPTCAANISVVQRDFRVSFDQKQQAWTAEWHWPCQEPPDLVSHVDQYPMSPEVRAGFEDEIDQWIEKGWLQPYDETRYGPPRATIPMMAVVQENKRKVRPVLDYRSLNAFLDAHTGDSDVCSDKLREWRRRGAHVSTLDLTSAYMQVRVAESLWPFQTVMFRGKRFCLTRLGFGLSIAPLVMKAVIEATFAQDEKVAEAVSSYVDDILVNESILSADAVRAHLLKYGLKCKPPERLADGARVLGLKVWGEQGEAEEVDHLLWSRGNELPDVPKPLTRRSVFSFCGKLTGHLPVCSWVRPAVSYLKRIANSLSEGWDDEIVNESLQSALESVIQRVRQSDPSKGVWNVSGEEATVWVNASSLAIGAVIEAEDCIIEDGCWLRPTNDSSHINLAELDALLRGVNMALAWKMKTLHLKTDSATVYHWVSDALTGKARLKTKSASEMLIRRRIGTLKEIVDEYELAVDIALVASCDNRADVLTRVPQRWLRCADPHDCKVQTVCMAVDANATLADRIFQIHCDTGHQGIERSLYFAKRLVPSVSRDEVEKAVRKCQICSSIDPAPIKWEKGTLEVDEVWHRVGMDITHVNGVHYLTLVDCGPSRFAIWRVLRWQDTASVTAALRSVFLERGAPVELLTDNDTAFRSEAFSSFAAKWGVAVHYRCAYVPSGNGIAERAHRTIKRIAARHQCPVDEAVYWYNASPRGPSYSDAAAPANGIYSYKIRLLGLDRVVDSVEVKGPYKVGDSVWVKPSGVRCDRRYGKGVVSKLVSSVSVEVDGIPRHIRDLRPASEGVETEDDDTVGLETEDDSSTRWESYDVPLTVFSDSQQAQGEESGESALVDRGGEIMERSASPQSRPSRERRAPVWLGDYVTDS